VSGNGDFSPFLLTNIFLQEMTVELITILLSGLLSSLSFGGIVADKAAESAISSRFNRIESIQVRIDNAPNLQIIAGKADRVRVAARGLWLTPDVRIEGFQMETDPIAVDTQKLQQDMSQLKLGALPKPLQAGVKFAMTEQDLNNALRSVSVLNRIQAIVSNAISTFGGSAGIVYKVENPQVRFLPNNRLGLKLSLSDSTQPNDRIDLDLETGIQIIGGRKIQLVEARGSANRIPLPGFILAGIVNGINEKADLAVLESSGITARVLEVKVVDKKMEVATFVRFQLPPAQQPM
jgi:LmeA-like phospholipid-binding